MLITIVTINYNNLNGLKKTMISVLEQTYKAIEYIVIDGGSTDGSKPYIEQNASALAYWQSEPDKGIYHAMNKGIDQATGDYLLFLNSGDWLANELVIEQFVDLKPTEGIVYGDPLVRHGKSWKRKYMPKDITIGIALTHTLSHQAQFYNKSIFEDGLRYDISYKCSGDRNLTNSAIIFKKCTTRYLDLIICYFEDPGISNDFNLRYTERKRFLKKNFDPLFLSLLKDYQKLQTKHNKLENRFLVKIAIWIHQKRSQLVHYFRS